jgi:DNA polymerase V
LFIVVHFISHPITIIQTMPKKAVKKAATKRASKRSGAGRPKGTGKFGCETKVIRVPVHLVDEIYEFIRRKINH